VSGSPLGPVCGRGSDVAAVDPHRGRPEEPQPVSVVVAVDAGGDQVGVDVVVGQEPVQPREQLLVVGAAVAIQDLDACRGGGLDDPADQAVTDRQVQPVAVRPGAVVVGDHRDGHPQSRVRLVAQVIGVADVVGDLRVVADVVDVDAVHDQRALGRDLSIELASRGAAVAFGVVLAVPADILGQGLLEVVAAARGQHPGQCRRGPPVVWVRGAGRITRAA